MTKYKPETHIVGKVYDLTQENMNAMLADIDRLRKENKRLREALESVPGELKRLANLLRHQEKWTEQQRIHEHDAVLIASGFLRMTIDAALGGGE